MRRRVERREGRGTKAAQLEESKYNYTKTGHNTETESRRNRRVSLKLESCFETTRLPCRLQSCRLCWALPFPNLSSCHVLLSLSAYPAFELTFVLFSSFSLSFSLPLFLTLFLSLPLFVYVLNVKISQRILQATYWNSVLDVKIKRNAAALNEASWLLDVHFNEPDDIVGPATLSSDNKLFCKQSRSSFFHIPTNFSRYRSVISISLAQI